jgi:hypothetical protein
MPSVCFTGTVDPTDAGANLLGSLYPSNGLILTMVVEEVGDTSFLNEQQANDTH